MLVYILILIQISCIINLVYKIIKSWNLKIEMNIIGDGAPPFQTAIFKDIPDHWATNNKFWVWKWIRDHFKFALKFLNILSWSNYNEWTFFFLYIKYGNSTPHNFFCSPYFYLTCFDNIIVQILNLSYFFLIFF